MAQGGLFSALGRLGRWTVWGLAGLLVVSIWFSWSNRANGPEIELTLEDGPSAAETDEATTITLADESAAADAPVGSAVSIIQGAVEGAVETANEAQSEAATAADDADAPADEERGQPDEEAGPGPEDAPTRLPNQAADSVVTDDEADHNILPPELTAIRVPGDDARYTLLSAFRRDDGTIEVVSERVLGEATDRTVRLVQCAPLAVGLIAENDGPRNDAPELERIPLGSAEATIAAMACGAMN